MTYFAGFDAAIYPGDATMAWLKTHSNLDWCGYYLSPAPNLYPPATSWRGRRAVLADSWGLAPIYVGQQVRHGASAVSSLLSYRQGCVDALEAVAAATRDGFKPGSRLFLDWEDGGALNSESQDYVGGWLMTVHSRNYAPGLYCSWRLADEFAKMAAALNARLDVRIWCWAVASTAEHPLATALTALPQVDPAGCGYAQAGMWQREQNASFDTLADAPQPGQRIVADFNSALWRDPGAQ